jgi:hypothetical protein
LHAYSRRAASTDDRDDRPPSILVRAQSARIAESLWSVVMLGWHGNDTQIVRFWAWRSHLWGW